MKKNYEKNVMTRNFNIYIQLLRPYQQIKNILLVVPLFFSAQITPEAVIKVMEGILCFSIASSLGYIINDWMDSTRDLHHPEKCTRPFCSDDIDKKNVVALWVILLVILGCVCVKFGMTGGFLVYLISYMVLTISYSILFKRIIIFDVFIISMGFVFRVMAGGAVCNIVISDWLFLTVFFISMLISIAKRKTELEKLTDTAYEHRESLNGYKTSFLANFMWTLGGVTLVVYSLYTVEKDNGLVLSVIPATYGIVRFIFLTEEGKGGDPIKTLFNDAQLIVTTFIFLIFLGIKIYL